MSVVDNSTLAVCGNGKVALVNVVKGTYTRYMTTSDKHNYSCILAGADRVLYLGTQKGELLAFDMDSGVELGQIVLEYFIRGLLVHGEKLIVFGGGKNPRNGSLTVLSPEMEIVAIV